jgi:hypothetical protein
LAVASLSRNRTILCARLQLRRAEIEEAASTRIYSVSERTASMDPDYVEGLRRAVSAALEYGLTAIEVGVARLPPVPAPLLVQARLAARNGIGLDVVLRRYVAGFTVLSDFIMQEAIAGETLEIDAVHRIGREQATLLDRILAAVSEEHSREIESRLGTSEERRAERVKRLLAGELVDTDELDYDFGANHLGVVAAGSAAAEALRALTDRLDCRTLLVRHGEGKAWAWLGTCQEAIDPDVFDLHAHAALPASVSLAVGEPSQGLAGWRLTHRQALAALPVALRGSDRMVRYSEVALVASMLQDDLLAHSLRGIYLTPLADERDGGAMLRETLRAYFAAGRNVSSAAAALGVSRRTVANRLRTVEDRIRRPLGKALMEIDAVLRLEELITR